MDDYDPIRDFDRVTAAEEARANRYSPENVERIMEGYDKQPFVIEALATQEAFRRSETPDAKRNTSTHLNRRIAVSKLDIDKRIGNLAFDADDSFCGNCKACHKRLEPYKQLLRDVLNEVRPERIKNALDPGTLIETDSHGRVYANEAAMWANGMYNSAIDDMESRTKEIGL